MNNQVGMATGLEMYAWASPAIKWFNFIPYKFKQQKQKQLQQLIDELERSGNKVMEICQSPFCSCVKIAHTKVDL